VTPERRIARAFALDDAGWARHANPWSGWTRVAILPLLALAGWSRVWIGPWWADGLLAALVLWTWVNPRAFPPPPPGRDAWMTRGVLGERIWLARDVAPVPAHHRLVPNLLSALSLAGGVVLVWGLVVLRPWPTLLGLAVAMLGKLWFLDRMAWLHRETTTEGPLP
jgi:hypothetical protein